MFVISEAIVNSGEEYNTLISNVLYVTYDLKEAKRLYKDYVNGYLDKGFNLVRENLPTLRKISCTIQSIQYPEHFRQIAITSISKY